MVANTLEKEIQRKICDWLYKENYFFWRSNNVPIYGQSNDGKFRYRAMPKYTPRGLPDIIIIHKGKFIAIEVKRLGSPLRPEQEEFSRKCFLSGGNYYIAHSVDEVKTIPELETHYEKTIKL